jgi:pyruvate/2-oxoacid:ferredoxin oxidoreductase beta subunit
MQKAIDIPRSLMTDEELVLPGLASCQGCGAALAMKLALKGLGNRTIVVFPACCWAVFVGTYPYSSLKVPVLHSPFAAAAIVASGAAAALEAKGEKDVVVMAWAGDGGTFDIGMQALSGVAERNDNILFVCYDNEAYMNTGIQRSSATPLGAWTTTTPAGSIKAEPKKDIEQILMAHYIPYVAMASISYPDDMYRKFKKVRQIRGTKFIHVLAPCPPGWRIDPDKSVQVTRMATQSRVFPIYEAEEGKYTINVYPEREIPVKEYVESQGRFGEMPQDMINALQEGADRKWEELVRMAGVA